MIKSEVVGGNGARGRVLVMDDGGCYLLPLGLHLDKNVDRIRFIIANTSAPEGKAVTAHTKLEVSSKVSEMVDYLSDASKLAEGDGRLSWRGTVGNTTLMFQLNSYLQLRPEFYKVRWSSIENLREALSDLYPESVLPHWGIRKESIKCIKEIAQNYFKDAIDHILKDNSVRYLSGKLEVSESYISRLKTYGRVSETVYPRLLPILVELGYCEDEVEDKYSNLNSK